MRSMIEFECVLFEQSISIEIVNAIVSKSESEIEIEFVIESQFDGCCCGLKIDAIESEFEIENSNEQKYLIEKTKVKRKVK